MGIVFGPTYATEKIHKLRWKPESVFDSNYYVTGSWDNGLNYIRLWLFPPVEDPYHEPVPVAAHSILADVTDMAFINSNNFVVSSSEGWLRMFKIIPDFENSELKKVLEWKTLHYYPIGDPCPCTDIATYEGDIATVGEDGRINFLKSDTSAVFRKMDEADCCAINSITFLTHSTALTGNREGGLKVWDVKSPRKTPTTVIRMEEKHVAVSCLNFHPTQRHILLVGTKDGRIVVWDMRNTTYPATMLDCHAGAVNEFKFHPTRPDHAVSCSESGELWHWDTTNNLKGTPFLKFSTNNTVEENVWLQGDAAVEKMRVLDLLRPSTCVNTVDLTNARIACGLDNQALYAFSGYMD